MPVDYVMDLLDLDHSAVSRIKASLLTFVPPTLPACSYLMALLPLSDLYAQLVIFCILSPVIMAWVGRKQVLWLPCKWGNRHGTYFIFGILRLFSYRSTWYAVGLVVNILFGLRTQF